MILDLIPILAIILSVVAITLVTSILTINIYVKIRKFFPSSVNCWFCNTWTKVPYESRNNFDCPTCLQYNGFNPDGSYNKIIEAQHDVRLNKIASLKTSGNTNGLCDYCNRNQQLKITQLASFTPLIEKNYDIEIEHFRNQLETAYKLCNRCSRVLKSTLLKEKASILGNHVLNIQKKGLKLLHLEPKQEVYLVIKFLKCLQGILALINIFNIVIQITSNDQDISKFLPDFLLPYFELFQDLNVFIYNRMEELPLDYLTLKVNYSYLQLFSSIGLILQLISFLLESSLVSVKVNQLLCWSFLTLTSWSSNEETIIYTYIFQAFCATLIFYNIYFGFDIKQKEQKTFKNFEKTKNLNESEYSDDDLDTSSQYNKSNYSTKETMNLLSRRTDDDYTAKKISSWTARNLSNMTTYSNLRTSFEDLHLDNSMLNERKCQSPRRESSPLSEKQQVLTPPKLKNVTQNSWVAGGFWRNQNGTVIPVTDPASISPTSSLSSGFGSQVREPTNGFNNPFYSLPTSRNASFCGNFDRFSLASEPAYHFRSISPQYNWGPNSYVYKSPQNNCHFDNSLRDISTSTYKFNELLVPSNSRTQSPVSVYNSTSYEPLHFRSFSPVVPMKNDVNDISFEQFSIDKL